MSTGTNSKMNYDKFSEILLNVIHAKKTFDMSATDDCLMDIATKLYISETIGDNKRENIKSMKEELDKMDKSMQEHPIDDWRKEPMTDGQVKFFRANRIPIAVGLLRGEASDIIDKKKKEK